MTNSIETPKTGKTKTSTSKTVGVKGKKAFKTYKQALKYLMERTDYERQKRLRYNVTTFDLARMEELLSLLGNPHNKIDTVHLAGTKGKGSTATMIARILEANGYNVGLYTSPHVTNLHERIAVNNEMVTDIEMLRLINRVYSPVEKMAKKDAPTFFEIMTALSFMHFLDKKVDIAVIETGMGGRLDSTNVIKPKVAGITSISIDHQQQLGNDIESIAMEKAGIIKEGIPTITVTQDPKALKKIKQRALELKSPLKVTGKDIDFSYRFESSREHGPHNRICITTPSSKFEHIRVPLPGEHQAINCGLALAMVDQLKQYGYEIENEKVIEGLAKVSLPGRMEIVCQDPRILVDGAHNAASIKALIQAIGQHIPYDSMVVIFACSSDKDVNGMLEQLQFGADKVIFTKNASPKAMLPQELAEMYTEICGKMCQTASTLGEALSIAKNAVTKEDLICITGSFYLVGQAKARFEKQI